MSKEEEKKRRHFVTEAKLPPPVEPRETGLFRKAKSPPPHEPEGTMTFRKIMSTPRRTKPKKTEDKRG